MEVKAEHMQQGDISTIERKEPEHPNVGLITTMPRSGTWYNHLFFGFYQQLLEGRTEISVTNSGIPLALAQCDLGVARLLVCHSICPGFWDYQGPYRKVWSQLRFHVKGYNWAEDWIRERKTLTDPAINPQVRIIYFYRNPLDQAVSSFRHAQHHEDPHQRSVLKTDGTRRPLRDVRDYLFSVGLESYIKQYVSYKIMQPRYPDNIYMFTYETLVRNPLATFTQVLDIFGHDTCDPLHQTFMVKALRMSSRESVKKIEQSLGHSLARDQTCDSESHICDGAIGKWKQHLQAQDLQAIQERLALFGVSLEEFVFE